MWKSQINGDNEMKRYFSDGQSADSVMGQASTYNGRYRLPNLVDKTCTHSEYEYVSQESSASPNLWWCKDCGALGSTTGDGGLAGDFLKPTKWELPKRMK